MGKYLIIIILFVASTSWADGLKKAKRLIGSVNISFIGERHTGPYNAKVLELLIVDLVEKGKLKAFATEAVLVSGDELLQNYLTEPNDRYAAEALKKLISYNLSNNRGWLAKNEFLELFSVLRRLKLKYGDEFRVCAIDEVAMLETFSPEHFELAQVQRLEKTSAFTDKTEEVLRGIHNFEYDRYKNDPGYSEYYNNHDREATMAQAAYECSKGGKDKTLVHMGANHITSMSLAKAWNDHSFIPASEIVRRMLLPKKTRMTTLFIDSPAIEVKEGPEQTEAEFCMACMMAPELNANDIQFAGWRKIKKSIERSSRGKKLKADQKELARRPYLIDQYEDYYILTPEAYEPQYAQDILEEHGY